MSAADSNAKRVYDAIVGGQELENELELLQALNPSEVSFDLTTYTPSEVAMIFDYLQDAKFAGLSALKFLLKKNPPSTKNRQLFDTFLNRFDLTPIPSFLYYAVFSRDSELTHLLLEAGANPNIAVNKSYTPPPRMESAGVLSAVPQRPNTRNTTKYDLQYLFEIAEDPATFDTLLAYGMEIPKRKEFLRRLKYSIFEHYYKDMDVNERFLVVCETSHLQLFQTFVTKHNIDLWDGPFHLGTAYLYKALHSPNTSAVVANYLWNLYKTKYPFTDFHYDQSTLHPMLSQRGTREAGFGTCAPDAMFTILFELPITKTLLGSVDPAKVTFTGLTDATLQGKYETALSAAKKRYDRMFGRAYTPSIPLRRTLSNSNNLYKNMFQTLRTCPPSEGGMQGLNILEIYDFLRIVFGSFDTNPLKLLYKTRYETRGLLPSPKGIVAIYFTIRKEASRHAVGFVKKEDDWYFLDSNVGFLHKMKDADWVLPVFYPRLFNTLETDEEDILAKPDKCVFLAGNRHFASDHLYYQFITLGDTLYPNREPELKESVLKGKNYWFPTGMIVISADSAPAPTAAAGAATGVSRGGRRTRRNKRRRSRSRRA